MVLGTWKGETEVRIVILITPLEAYRLYLYSLTGHSNYEIAVKAHPSIDLMGRDCMTRTISMSR